MRVKALFSFVGVYGSVKPGQILELTDSEHLEHYLRLGLVMLESPTNKPQETPTLKPESNTPALETPIGGPEVTDVANARKRGKPAKSDAG